MKQVLLGEDSNNQKKSLGNQDQDPIEEEEEEEGVGVNNIQRISNDVENSRKSKEPKKQLKKSTNSIHNITELLGTKFWEQANWLDIVCEVLFHIKRRDTTIEFEIYAGIVQFISCMYVLPVIPEQMINAGYDPDSSYAVTAAMCGIGCIFGGLFANLPFIIAPPTAISIFLSIFLQQNQLDTSVGNQAVVASGIGLIFLGYRPLGRFLSQLIPYSIQVGTAVGIGLLTALAGATEIDLVVTGHYTIVKLGKITAEVMITIAGSTIIGIALHYHVKGAFCLALCFGTIVWWTYDNSWPNSVASLPKVSLFEGFSSEKYQDVILLTLDLLFLYILTLSGLVSSLSSLSGLVRPDGTTPRNRWLYIVCGLCTCLSGLLSGPPILISPESASGIKGGAKTGLSTLVCGLLFSLSVFFNPIFRHVPSAATAPLLIGVGVILFQNVHKLNWKLVTESMPAYFVLFFIPFTYSILQGVAIGYVIYLILGVFTGQIFYSALHLYISYFGVPFTSWKMKKLMSSQSDNGVSIPHLERQFSTDDMYVEQLHGNGTSSRLSASSPTQHRAQSPPPTTTATATATTDRLSTSFNHTLSGQSENPLRSSMPNETETHHNNGDADGIILNPGWHDSIRLGELPFFPSERGYLQYLAALSGEREWDANDREGPGNNK